MKRIAIIILASMVFGVIMALRAEAHGLWLRAGIAGLAGACFAVGLVYATRGRPHAK